MQHPDEGMIHTWLDGELPAAEAAALETHAATCAQCQAAIAEARGFIAASSRIIGTLDNVPGDVIPVAKSVKRVWYTSPQFRAAAAVLIVAGASFLVMRPVTQKSAVATSDNAEMRDASTAQSPMSASATAAAAAPSPVQPPVVAEQALSKKEAVKPVTTAPPKGFAVLAAPVRERVLARISPPGVKVANEADFSGKGVKGGTANGVAGVPAVPDSAALSGRVAGVAMKASDALSTRRDFRPTQADLKVVRIDSTATTKKTTYASLSGEEIVLIEETPAPVLSKAVVTGTAEEKLPRAATAPSPAPAVANAPVAPAAVAQRTAIHTISWIDPLTRRHYSLSGRVSVEELEAIKVRLQQTNH